MVNQKNLLLAIALTIGILLAWDFFFVQPQNLAEQIRVAAAEKIAELKQPRDPQIGAPGLTVTPPRNDADSLIPTLPAEATSSAVGPTPETGDPSQVASARVPVEGYRIGGSIDLKGARLDDLTLLDYYEQIDPQSPQIVVLRPTPHENAYYAEFGWTSAPGSVTELPGSDTVWTARGNKLTSEKPLTLVWVNDEGVRFTRTYSLDENYMFTVTQQIENFGPRALTLAPYGLVSRSGTPKTSGFYILHEGPLGVFNDTLTEVDYDDLREERQQIESSTGGWIGFTDKYWLTALIPEAESTYKARFTYRQRDARDQYQVDYLGEAQEIGVGESVSVESRFFVGAKEVNLIDAYEDRYQIQGFDRSIDWGWLYFITKPIFYTIDFFAEMLGNFGLAILLLTVLIKMLFFPLANKSYMAMNKMKQLQPKMTELRERFKEDKARQQREIMELYKKENVNPLAGCWPIIIQIPVFFALYKVLFVTIEMRHEPFFGWIKDLSAPDPLTPVNLFGMIPWDPPALIAIGVWPIMMGLSMFLQQKMNPQPPDPIQAKVFMLMPIMFTFFLASFPVGLVIYWTWNNLLSIGQQWLIKKRTGST